MKSQKRFFSGGHSYEELRKDTLIWRHGTKGMYSTNIIVFFRSVSSYIVRFSFCIL